MMSRQTKERVGWLTIILPMTEALADVIDSSFVVARKAKIIFKLHMNVRRHVMQEILSIRDL